MKKEIVPRGEKNLYGGEPACFSWENGRSVWGKQKFERRLLADFDGVRNITVKLGEFPAFLADFLRGGWGERWGGEK